MKILFLVLLLLACRSRSIAQLQNKGLDIKFRLAQSYERSGDIQASVKLYQELFAKDSTNVVFFDALRRDYLLLKMYDEAIALYQRMLQRTPGDIIMLTQLGSTYILQSEEPKAVEVWERALAVNPKNETTYRVVAGSMLQSRLFDRAIGVYQRGRIACANPTLFTPDIAYLYSIMLKYQEATREYLNFVRQSPEQLSFTQSRIASYTGRSDGLNAATSVVEQAVKTESNNLSFQQLLAWLYMEGKHYDRAYEVYTLIDDRNHANGHELYTFAMRALKEHAFIASSKAFLEIARKYPKFDQLAEAKFGYARTLEASDDESDTLKLFGRFNPFTSKVKTESPPLFAGAIAAYNGVIAEFPKSEIAAQALFRIAILKQEKYFDLDGARAALESLENSYVMYPIHVDAVLRLGDVYLAMDDLTNAEKKYQSIAGEHGLLTTPQQQLAVLRLAEVNYFRTKFTDALAQLKELTKNISSDVTNDALSLQMFIQENTKASPEALKAFAHADLLRRKQKLSEALTAFEPIVRLYPKSDVIDETLIAIGDVLTQMNRFPEAIAAYDRLMKDFPESIARDKTLMKMGQVYQLGLKDPAKAIATYQQLLEEFSSSIYTSEARKRIRELRGDNI